jgi:thioesterase III
MDFSTDIKIRGFHIDVFGHMNNARYLELMEDARWQYIDATNFQEYLTKNNWGFAVVNINISYKKPAHNGDILTFTQTIKRMGNSSMTIDQIMTKKNTGELVASAEVTFVVLDLASHRPARISDEIKKASSTAKS